MKSKRFIVILIGIIFSVAVLVSGIFVFTVKEIKVDYTLISKNADEIRESADKFVGKNLLFVKPSSIKNKIEQDPYIEVVSVKKSYPNVIKVEVVERREAYIYTHSDGRTYILDGEGFVLKKLTDGEQISGRNFIGIVKEDKFGEIINEFDITGVEVGSNVKTTDNGTFSVALALAKSVGLADCIEDISVITRGNDVKDVYFLTYTGVTIKIEGVDVKGDEKVRLAFEKYKNSNDDFIKTFDTIIASHLVDKNNEVKVVWSSLGE